MSRKLAVLVALCILLGTCIAFTDTQPAPSSPESQSGTRATFPGDPWTENITADTTWNTNSYIYVRRDIWVMENATLTVPAGVTVRFERGTGLFVKGGIIADGAPFKNVTFMPYNDDFASGDWLGIHLDNSTDVCLFDNVAIRYSQHGVASWGSDFTITNSSIEYTFYYGVLVGEGSSSTIRNNLVNFTTWAGIVTGNNTDAEILHNYIRTSNYGIVCYDTAEITENNINLCWLGILAWGNANLTRNQIRDCMDGIHGFYASPRVEGNLIVSCDGNGTRFIHSNAVLSNNTLAYNNVGMDIDYESRHLLATMVNNRVNGIEITDCFFVGKSNLVIDDLFIDSGWSKGYYGSLTAQGSVTLYDCRNVTIQNSRIINTVNSVFATNSTFRIYASDLGNAVRSQVCLDANATGIGFNRSVDPNSVIINGDNCLFQTYDSLRIRVEDYFGNPILGARVIVKEGLLTRHDAITDLGGNTPILVVNDRTVSMAGVIASPLSAEVIIEGYNFDPNPMTGIYVNQTGNVTFRDLGDIFPPAVQNISVDDGNRSFPVDGTITVRFSEAMNRTSAENAFSISGNVTGNFTWDGFNLTFTPDSLDFGTYYTVLISSAAADEWGNSLGAPISFSFTTVQEPASGSNTLVIALVAIFIIGGVAGFIVLKRLK